MRRDDGLFFTCSLIECIARDTGNTRKTVVQHLKTDIERIYEYADVFHCEPIHKVANDFAERNGIPFGDYDYKSGIKYDSPSCWEIGGIFERLIEDTYAGERKTDAVVEIFSSWLADKIFDFNSDLYYQPRDYLAECYKVGEILDD